MTESFYDVLDIAEDATTDEIETAYRQRLKETHPDVSDDEDAGQATRTLIEARDVLVDEGERARYDRLGHEVYVSDGPDPPATEPGDHTSQPDAASDDDSDDTRTGEGSDESRSRRERRATASGESGSNPTASASTSTTTDRDPASSGGRRTGTTDPTTATATGTTYSVREDVATPGSYGPLLPRGQQLTLLGIFFALYPVLLFSALLPAFPPVVNLVLSACTLLLIIYLQSMPRVALCLFGGWSGIGIVGLAVFGVGYVSPVGLVVLAGTVLPFGFSVLTASALRR